MTQPKIIGVDGVFDVMPDQIDASRQFMKAFGQFETEEAARCIVQFCQERKDGWKPFTQKEINKFFRDTFAHDRNPNDNDKFCFYNLMGEFPLLGYEDQEPDDPIVRLDVIVRRGKKFFVTDEFVLRCHKSSPAKNPHLR